MWAVIVPIRGCYLSMFLYELLGVDDDNLFNLLGIVAIFGCIL